jgi:hypothetical protein
VSEALLLEHIPRRRYFSAGSQLQMVSEIYANVSSQIDPVASLLSRYGVGSGFGSKRWERVYPIGGDGE